jgi:iron complex transport system permease protein
MDNAARPGVSRPLKTLILILPLPAMVLGICVGAFHIPLNEMGAILMAPISEDRAILSSQAGLVFWNIRLPRVILAILAGMAFSVSGSVFQSLFKNPLVDSYILGLSAGASFGAALALSFLPAVPVQLLAFVFGLGAVGLTYLAARGSGAVTTISLVLAGVMVSAVFSAFLWIIQMIVDPIKLQGIVYWLMGSFATASWDKVISALPLIFVGTLGVYAMRWNLNVISMGEEEARSMGIHVKRDTLLLILFAAMASTSAVAMCGIVGLVGLIIPQAVRMLFGPDNRTLVPLSMALGAAYLLLVDTLARNLVSFEIPVGIITTLVGAPFFILILRQTRAGGWNL